MIDKEKKFDILFSLSDLFYIGKRHKNKILLSAAFFGCLGFIYALSKPVVYTAKATFREKGKSHLSFGNNLSSIFLTGGRDLSQSEAITTLTSQTVLKKLIAREHLQGTLTKRGDGHSRIKAIPKNLWIEYGLFYNRQTPFFKEQTDPVKVVDIHYNSEYTAIFRIKFLDDQHFEVLRSRTSIPQLGKLGEKVIFPDITFTIQQEHQVPLADSEYKLVIEPLNSVIERLSTQINATTDTMDNTLIKLQYSHSNRHFAAHLLNSLMQVYQDFLQEELHRVSSRQLQYLSQRNNDMKMQLQQTMEEQALSLSSDVYTMGFPAIQDAITFFAAAQQQTVRDLLNIDLELIRLDQMQNCKGCIEDQYAPETASASIASFITQIKQLKKQYDSLQNETRDRIINKDAQYVALYDGVDLPTAKEMTLNYGKELSRIESDIAHRHFLLQGMQDPAFEMSALVAVLSDPISQKMANQAGTVLLALSDSDNRSTKEQERLRRELENEKGFLSSHLKHHIQLLKLQEGLTKGKILELQTAMQDLIQNEIALLQKHLNEHIQTRIENLKTERQVIEKHQNDLQKEMANLPKRRVAEQLINQQMDINSAIVEDLAKMVESKNTMHNLEIIQSTPVDLAIPPIIPKAPKTLFMIILGSFFGFIAAAAFFFLRALVKGFPLTAENLRLSHFYVAGNLSAHFLLDLQKPLLDKDLETLRNVISHLGKEPNSKSALLLAKPEQDFSKEMAELLSKAGSKVMILQLQFNSPEYASQPGLIQYLEGTADHPNIQRQTHFDIISAGGITRFSNELLESPRFKSLLQELKANYDWIIAVAPAALNSSESDKLFNHFQNAVITVTNQTWPELKDSSFSSAPERVVFVCA